MTRPSGPPAAVLTRTEGSSNGSPLRVDDSRVVAAVQEYRAALEAGEKPSRQALVAQFPEIAGELGACLDALEFVQSAIPQLKSQAIPTVADSSGAISATGQLGDYRLIRELGRGGMGVVYEAEQVSLGRRVALKVLPFAAVLDPKQLQRFKNEALAAAHLDHPHVVEVYAVGCERGVHYYAMRYVEGQTLAEVIRELRRAEGRQSTDESQPEKIERRESRDESQSPDVQHPPDAPVQTVQQFNSSTVQSDPYAAVRFATTPAIAALSTQHSTKSKEFFRTVAELGRQAAEALEHAHEMGVIHRDIKPSNLLLDLRGNLWITDFGLARILSPSPLGGEGRGEGRDLTMTGDLIGTLRYMSPEQALAKRVVVDHRTDIYSLGVTLYELLTLEPAFGGSDRQELLRQIAFEEPRPPQRINRSIPADLETITLKAMAKNPAERYATAQDFVDDVRRFVNDEPIRARRPGPVTRLRKLARRHKGLTTAAIALLFTALAAGGVLKLRRDSQLREIAQSVRESLAGARAAVEAKSYTAALQRLAIAEGRLAEGGRALASLSHEVRAFRDEIERFERFRQLTDVARWWDLSPERYAQIIEALSLYGVLDDPEWSAKLEGGVLPAEKIGEIRKIAYEMLLSLADNRIRSNRDIKSGDKISGDAAGRQTLNFLEKAGSFYPPTPAFYHVRSKCWRALGNGEAEEADAKRAKELQASLALDHFLPGRDASWSGQKEEALRQSRAALRVEPDHYPSLFFTGIYLHSLERHEEALVAFTGCAALRPKHASAYVNRGASQMSLGRLDEALADFNKAITVDPERFGLYVSRASVYRRLGRPQEALADLTKAQGMAPQQTFSDHEQAGIYNSRGYLLLDFGKLQESLADFTKAIELNPNEGAYYTGRGLAYFQLGKLAEAEQDWRQGLTQVQKELAGWLPKPSHRSTHGALHQNLGTLLVQASRNGEAEQHLRQALAVQEKLATDFPDQPGLRQDLARTHLNLGNLLKQMYRYPESEEAYRQGLDRLAKLVADFRGDSGDRILLAVTERQLGGLLTNTAQYEEAEKRLQQAVTLQEKLVSERPRDPEVPMDLARAYGSFGTLLRKTGRPKEAEKVYNQSLILLTNLANEFPADRSCKDLLAWTYMQLGDLLHNTGRREEAEDAFRRALELREKLAADWPAIARYQSELARNYDSLGNVLEDLRRPQQAEAALRQALCLEQKLITDFPCTAEYSVILGATLGNLGRLLRDLGQLEQAREYLEQSIPHLRAALESNPQHADCRLFLGNNYLHLARTLGLLGEQGEATKAHEQVLQLNPNSVEALNNVAWFLATCPDPELRDISRAVALARKAAELAPQAAYVWNTLGVAHYRAGDWRAAIEGLQKSEELAPGKYFAFNAFSLAMAHWQLGEKDEARKWYDQAVQWMEKNKSDDEELRRFRAEAEELLGVKEQEKE